MILCENSCDDFLQLHTKLKFFVMFSGNLNFFLSALCLVIAYNDDEHFDLIFTWNDPVAFLE